MFEISEADYWVTGFPGYDAYVRRPLTEKEKMHVEIYKTLNWSILYGAAGMGKNYEAARRVRENVARMRNGNNVSDRTGETIRLTPQMPQRICNYRKREVHWYGTETPRYSLGAGFEPFHWKITADMLTVKGMDPKYGLSVLPPMGTTTGRFASADPLKGRRFISVSEASEDDPVDYDFLKRFTGDEWVETRTLDGSSKAWEPKGELFVMSGKPLKINDKSKETIEKVKSITYP